MKIDKTRFLVLTSGLAAASAAALIACSSSTTKTDNPNNGTDSGTTDSGGTDTGTTGDGGGDAAVACLSDKGPEPFCSAEGIGVDAGDDADTDAAATDAGSQQPSACPEHCDVVKLNFKSDVAEDIKKCLDNGTMGCDNAALLDCENAALAKTCDDATVTALCTPIVAACADAGADGGVAPTQEGCEKLMKGLNQIGRDSFTGCVQEGIESCGSCLDQVTKYPGG